MPSSRHDSASSSASLGIAPLPPAPVATPAATHHQPDADAAQPNPLRPTIPSIPPIPASPHGHMIMAGLASGVSVAGLFNPWDRALYLSVLHTRPFLTPANFHHPYQGFLQVVVHRTLSGGLYFPLFDMAQPFTKEIISNWAQGQSSESRVTPAEQSALLHFVCGNFAGGVSGILLNGLTAVKYASWDGRTGFFQTARDMYVAGGHRPFFKGVNATVARDTIFGGVFALAKFQLVKLFKPYVYAPTSGTTHATNTATATAAVTATAADSDTDTDAPHAAASHAPSTFHLHFSSSSMDFSAALLAGLIATTISAPLNYVRNIKYGWPSQTQPPSSTRILIDLWTESRRSQRIGAHLQERLRLGWGTARVAVGMAVGQFIYEATKNLLDERHPHPPKRKKHAHTPT